MDLADFRKPFNLITLGLAVIGLLWGIYSTYSAHSEAKVSFYSATIQIVDQKETVPFSVIDKSGQPVKENVYATNVTVWNSCNLPIDERNIRTPLTISLTEPVRLLDAKFDYITGDNISEFRIENDPKNNVVQIGWRFFDPDAGFRLRLIYAAADVSDLKLNGIMQTQSKCHPIGDQCFCDWISF